MVRSTQAPDPTADLAREAPREAALREEDMTREQLRGSLTRKRKNGGFTDRFGIPKEQIPDGWTYEWKRHTIVGQEDPSYTVETWEQGWRPVPAQRHPQFMPNNYTGKVILRDGLMLMERPEELTREAILEDKQRAQKQFRDKMAQIQGEGPNPDSMPRNKPTFKTSYEGGLDGEGIAVPE